MEYTYVIEKPSDAFAHRQGLEFDEWREDFVSYIEEQEAHGKEFVGVIPVPGGCFTFEMMFRVKI